MPRISGVDIPNDKPIWVSLTYIHGLGPTNSRQLFSYPETGDDRGVTRRPHHQRTVGVHGLREADLPAEEPAEPALQLGTGRLRRLRIPTHHHLRQPRTIILQFRRVGDLDVS